MPLNSSPECFRFRLETVGYIIIAQASPIKKQDQVNLGKYG